MRVAAASNAGPDPDPDADAHTHPDADAHTDPDPDGDGDGDRDDQDAEPHQDVRDRPAARNDHAKRGRVEFERDEIRDPHQVRGPDQVRDRHQVGQPHEVRELEHRSLALGRSFGVEEFRGEHRGGSGGRDAGQASA